MRASLEQYHYMIAHSSIGFVGVGVSHRELIRQYAAAGARLTVRDKRPREALGAFGEELERLGVRLVCGPDYLADITEEVLFRTPGMKYHTPELDAARARGTAVTSEMELFFALCPCPVYAVTGSDGKTTSTTLIAEMLRRSGRTVHLGGNIGTPLLPVIGRISPNDVAVVELSSFQLISMRQSPDTALVTNVAPNHLDIHKDMQEYVDAKRNILLHQGAFGRAVLNRDNAVTRQMAEDVRGELCWFSRRDPVERGAFLSEDGWRCHAGPDGVVPVFPMESIRIPGMHNVENYLGVIAALWGAVDPAVMAATAREFAGVEHRIEFVRELDGVKWYNDSIATNPTRMIAGLESFEQKLIVLAGGYDKKIPFEPLAEPVCRHVKTLILTGATADKIEAAVTACPAYAASGLTILRAADLPEAVALARREAKSGDIVTLSPACASFDSYPNFEARGRHYKELVRDLK